MKDTDKRLSIGDATISTQTLVPTQFQPSGLKRPETLPPRSAREAHKNTKRRWKKAFLTFFIVVHICILLMASFLLVYYRQQLPKVDQYAHEVIPQDTRIYDRNNVLLYDAYAQNQSNSGRRISVTLPEIPKVMQDAMVATEDRTFWTNPGIIDLTLTPGERTRRSKCRSILLHTLRQADELSNAALLCSSRPLSAGKGYASFL